MSGNKRLTQLDGLRGIAILLVFFYHAFNIPLFWSGVDLFFVLSGFLITGVLLRLKETRAHQGMGTIWRQFYARRIRRIFPPYYLLLAVVACLVTAPWERIWYWYVFFAANIGYLLLENKHVHALMPLWSLAVEEQFYFAWPVVVFLTSLKTIRRVAIGMMVGAPILRACVTPFVDGHMVVYVLTPFRLDVLACGAFIAAMAYDNPDWLRSRGKQAGWGAMACGFLICLLSVSPSFRLTASTIYFNTLGYSLIALLFGCLVVHVLGRENGLLATVLRHSFLRFMGMISYTFYLTHYGILFFLRDHLHSKLAITLLTFLITMVVSLLSWWFLEAPLLGLPRSLPSDNKASRAERS